jgi:hypothetical protein
VGGVPQAYGGGLSLRRTSGPLEHRPSMAEGPGPGRVEIMSVCGLPAWQALWSWSQWRSCRPEGHGLAEIVNACRSLAWQALRAQSGGDCVGLRGGSLGDHGPGGAEEWAQGLEISQPAEPLLCKPMGWSLAC